MPERTDRFEAFVLLIDAIHKSISKVKQELIDGTPIKSVHTMWLYELMKHPMGLTAAELAAKSRIDRSLVSRELCELSRHGYVAIEQTGKRRAYNSRITLTVEGEKIARRISAAASEVQMAVGRDISSDELVLFYSTLEKIYNNLAEVTDGGDDVRAKEKGII